MSSKYANHCKSQKNNMALTSIDELANKTKPKARKVSDKHARKPSGDRVKSAKQHKTKTNKEPKAPKAKKQPKTAKEPDAANSVGKKRKSDDLVPATKRAKNDDGVVVPSDEVLAGTDGEVLGQTTKATLFCSSVRNSEEEIAGERGIVVCDGDVLGEDDTCESLGLTPIGNIKFSHKAVRYLQHVSKDAVMDHFAILNSICSMTKRQTASLPMLTLMQTIKSKLTPGMMRHSRLNSQQLAMTVADNCCFVAQKTDEDPLEQRTDLSESTRKIVSKQLAIIGVQATTQNEMNDVFAAAPAITQN